MDWVGGTRKIKKYYYNADTHRFEKFVLSWKVRLLRVFGFLSTATVTALIIVAIAFRFLDTVGPGGSGAADPRPVRPSRMW